MWFAVSDPRTWWRVTSLWRWYPSPNQG
jgi:hypothetical protein